MQHIEERNQPSRDASPARLDPATTVGRVTLKVAELRRALDFYTGIVGLQLLDRNGRRALLGAGGRPILALEEVPGAEPAPENSTGLYHAAILFPDRRTLAIKVSQLAAARYPFGYGDHLVSEAFYLSDPDGNGLELYRDRPRADWQWSGGQVRMASDPIDFDSLFAEVPEGDPALYDAAVPAATRLGHVHLRVADLVGSERFYGSLLGFDVTARMPGALFMSAGGYHHHLGLNTWQSRGGHPPDEPSAGLREFSLLLPSAAELDRLAGRLSAAGLPVEPGAGSLLVGDPAGNRVRLLVGAG